MAKNTTSKNLSGSNYEEESQGTSKNAASQAAGKATSRNAVDEGNSTKNTKNCHNSYDSMNSEE